MLVVSSQASFKRFLDLRTSKSERDPSLAFFDTCIEAHIDGTANETRCSLPSVAC